MAPLLFLLAFGIIDFGRAMYYQNEITNAAREGARIAILGTNPCNAVYGPATASGACPAAGADTPAGPSVCSAIEGNASLIGNWSCGDVAPVNTIPATGKPGYAYVEVDQSSPLTNSCPSLGLANATTPRSGGNLLIMVTIHYYFRPITPIVSAFFPATFYLSSSVCARDEY